MYYPALFDKAYLNSEDNTSMQFDYYLGSTDWNTIFPGNVSVNDIDIFYSLLQNAMLIPLLLKDTKIESFLL